MEVVLQPLVLMVITGINQSVLQTTSGRRQETDRPVVEIVQLLITMVTVAISRPVVPTTSGQIQEADRPVVLEVDLILHQTTTVMMAGIRKIVPMTSDQRQGTGHPVVEVVQSLITVAISRAVVPITSGRRQGIDHPVVVEADLNLRPLITVVMMAGIPAVVRTTSDQGTDRPMILVVLIVHTMVITTARPVTVRMTPVPTTSDRPVVATDRTVEVMEMGLCSLPGTTSDQEIGRMVDLMVEMGLSSLP